MVVEYEKKEERDYDRAKETRDAIEDSTFVREVVVLITAGSFELSIFISVAAALLAHFRAVLQVFFL